MAAAAATTSRAPTRLNSWSATDEASHRYQEEPRDEEHRAMLAHTTDHYNGVTVDPAGLPGGDEEFKEALVTSLEEWKLTGRKGVWLKVTTAPTNLPRSRACS